MTIKQQTGAMPQKMLSVKCLTMDDVKQMRENLYESSLDLLSIADEENCWALRNAGENISTILHDVLEKMTEEPSEQDANLAHDFQLLAEKYGFEKKGEKL